MYCDCQNTADLFIYLYSWWLIFLDCGVFFAYLCGYNFEGT